MFLYLNYHPTNDFVVNLENIWKFIGFSNKANGKRLLKQHFTENKDYKLIFIRTDENKTLLMAGVMDGVMAGTMIILDIEINIDIDDK